MILATPNIPILLSVLASDGNTGLFARARIYDSANAFVTAVSLTNVVEGLYQSQHTFVTEGVYTVVYQFFLDAGFIIPAVYDKNVESVDVSSFKTDVLRILGLVHENSVVDLQVYDGDDNLLSARIRCYDSTVNAAAASATSPASYTTGLRFEYTVAATYTGTLLNKYVINRVT